jgi:hypothetical protein
VLLASEWNSAKRFSTSRCMRFRPRMSHLASRGGSTALQHQRGSGSDPLHTAGAATTCTRT